MTPRFAPIRDKIERAARNGERLHLEPDQVRALVKSPLFGMLAEMAAKEFAELWEDEVQEAAPPPAMTTARVLSSGPTGSNIKPSGTSGASPGMIETLVHDAAERLAYEAAAAARRPRRRGKR